MAACNLGNCTIHEILKCVSEILLVGNDDNTRDDDDGDGDGEIFFDFVYYWHLTQYYHKIKFFLMQI